MLLANEYGKEANLDLSKVICNLGYGRGEIIKTSLATYKQIIDLYFSQGHNSPALRPKSVAFNLCDGTEDLDRYPGLSVVLELESQGVAFTGSNSRFFHDTTSKPTLKKMLQDHAVPTSPFVEIRPECIEGDMIHACDIVG